jgi:hypothetical protein
MLGHALVSARGRPARANWDRSIAAGFAIGSVCFFVGPFPGFVQLVGQGADGVVFFVGSIFFTFAAALELREGTLRRQRRFADASWWSAAVQFAGTLLFNISTLHAMETGLSTHEQNRLVWAPDLLGSVCFLVSAWVMAGINLTGCVLFGVSAIASYVVPSTGSVLALAPANWGTALGALCFLTGALLLGRQSHRAEASSE